MTTAEELQSLKNLREKVIAAMDGAVDSAEVENYNFNDGSGGQSVKRRSPLELMKLLEEIDKKIAALEANLRGGSVMSFSTNRYK
jgi:hypothetical protein